jgi:hypothetical protein
MVPWGRCIFVPDRLHVFEALAGISRIILSADRAKNATVLGPYSRAAFFFNGRQLIIPDGFKRRVDFVRFTSSESSVNFIHIERRPLHETQIVEPSIP